MAPPPYTNVRLFGNRNVGNVFRSNLQIAGMVPRGERYAVTNWYARTNILTPPAEFHAFARSTIVTLQVGMYPAHELALSDLLQRKEGQQGFTTNSQDFAISDALAENTYIASANPMDVQPPVAWRLLQDFEQDAWRRISRAAHRLVSPPILALIPERQTYAAHVATDRRALGAMLEVLPTNVAPESLIWIHLEGVRHDADVQ